MRMFRRSLVRGCFILSLSLAVADAAAADGAAAASGDSSNRTAIAVEALSRLKGMDLEANPTLKAAVMRVVDQTKGTAQFVELIRDFNLKGQNPALLEFLLSNPDHSASVEAAKLIFEDDGRDLIRSTLNSTNAPVLVEVLGKGGLKQAVPLLEPMVTDAGKDIELRRKALHGLTQTQEGAAAVLDLAGRDKLPADLKLAAGAELHQARWPEIKSRAAELLPLPSAQEGGALPPISELVKRSGNASHGREVFFSPNAACSSCHQVNGQGTDFGPKLSEIGTKLGKDALYEAIVNPSSGISFGYEGWQIELKNGDEAFGIINSETPDEIAVKAQTGVITRIKKSDLAKREKQPTSIMPAGLQEAMSTQDLVDLVEYLSTLKSAGK